MADNDLPIKGLPDAGTIDPVNDMLPIEQAATGKVSPAALIALALQQTLTSFSAGANLPVNSADSIFSGFQKLQGQLNNKTTFQRITLAAINTAISASGLTYPGFYEIYDAVSATKRVVVFASSVSAVSSLAFNLTDNTFGSYNISTDAFTALAQPNSILNGIGAPSGSVGNNGDFYMDTAGIFLFGPKTSGAWGAGISLVPLEDIVVDTTFTASPYTPMSGRDQWIRVDTTDGNCTLNVSSSSVDGETYYISNAAGTHNVVFNTSLTIAPGNSALVKYDASTTTWLVLFTTGAAWGTLSGTLSSQTDLQSALDAKQNLLGFTAENVANKDTDGTLTANSDTRYPSQKAVKTYVDASVVGLLDDRGNFDASGNAFPSSGGSGASGAIRKGDLWYISVAGTLGSVPVMVGDSIRALNDAPGSTSANWDILNVGIGYVPENVANKDTDGTLSSNSDTKYASQKATKTYVDTGLSGKLSTSATTDAVTEGTTNKYFTTARVLATALTGYAAAGSRTAIAATDTVLQAFGKVGKYLGDLAAVAFSGSYSDLTGTPTALPPNGSAGGDLSGTYPNPTIKTNVALGGSPTTTTQTSGDNSTKIATTAFVHTVVASSETPLIGSTSGLTSRPTPGGTTETWFGVGAGTAGGSTNGTIFEGQNAGYGATSADYSIFIGSGISGIWGAGMEATNAANSVFIGGSAGINAINAANSIFIGTSAGIYDTVDNVSTFGTSIIIGPAASTGGFSNSIALGFQATNTQSNEFLVASAYNIWNIAGVPYVMPSSSAAGALTNDGAGNLSWSGSGGTNLIGQTNGLVSNPSPATGDNETFFGYQAGDGANTAQNTFIGAGAGFGASSTGNSTFIGVNAGSNATNANDSIFIGLNAGYGDLVNNSSGGTSILIGENTSTGNYSNSIALGTDATNNNNNQLVIGSTTVPVQSLGITSDSSANQLISLSNQGNQTETWIGRGAGQNGASTDNTIFIGTSLFGGAGYGASNAGNSVMIGAGNGGAGEAAGYNATNAYGAVFIGQSAGSNASNAANSIFIGQWTGFGDTVDNVSTSGYSILIGGDSGTGGFSNSIGIGNGVTNTAANQFLIGSAGAPINDLTVIQNTGASKISVSVAWADSTTQTTDISDILSMGTGAYTTPADGTYRIGGWLNVTAISATTIKVFVAFIDINGVSRTRQFLLTNDTSQVISAPNGIGEFSIIISDIRVQSGSAITISTLTTGAFSCTYDISVYAEYLGF